MPLNKGLNINQAKAAVISAVAQGSTIEAACKGAGRTVKAHENWRASDKEYARQIDEVRSIRKGAIAKGADADAFNLSFAEWRLRYLRRETYPHMQNMIDVVEGREPGWLHPSMMWEPKRPNRAIINIPPFHAKALALETPVFTEHGWKTVGSIRVGDRVFGPDGKPTSVTAKSETFHKPCFGVRLSSGETVVASEDHVWTVLVNRRPVDLTTREIFERGGPFQLPSVEALVTDDVTYPLDPYLLGAWLGDGHTADAMLTGADPEIADEFVKAGFPVMSSFQGVDTGKAKTYRFAGLFSVLSELGLRGNKMVPEGYLLGSFDQRLALLQGLMDTDGTVSVYGQCSFTNTNKQLADSVLFLASSLGERATLREFRTMLNGKDCGPAWTVTWTPRGGEVVPFRLERKARRVGGRLDGTKPSTARLRKISSVEPVETVPTQCLAVDNESHLFLVGWGLIPTHNTQTVTVDYVTYKLTQNPNFRVVVVSKRQEQAKKFLGQIRQRLTSNLFAELQATYGGPSGFKGDGAKWTQNMLYLAGRDSDAADASIEALGIGGQIYGTRSDLIILDDCVVGSNAAEYEKQINWLESEVENRVFDGKILIIGTRLAPNDMYSELRSGERYLSGSSPWSYLRMPMVLEYAEKPADWVTLWPKSHRPMDENDAVPLEDGMYQAWDGVRASQTRDSKPPRTWNLVYQQMDAAEDAVFDAKCVQGSIERRRKPGPLSAGGWGHPRNGSEGMQTIMSVDPAGTGEAFCLMYAVNKADKKRYVLNAWTARNTTPAWYADLIEANHQVYGFGHLVIESNAYASWIIEDQRIQGFCRSAGVRIIPHYTGRNKQNPDFGVASLAPLLGSISRIHDGTGRGVHEGNNLVEFPDPDYSPGVKALIDQLISWQPNKLGKQLRMDGPMAWWFAELVARNMIGAGQKLQPFMRNEYLSRGDLADRKVVPIDAFRQLYA